VARWAPPKQLSGYGRRLAHGLESTLSRIRHDYEAKYIGGHAGQIRTERPSASNAARALQALQHESGFSNQANIERSNLEELNAFIAEMDDLLAGLARSHLYHHQPLSEHLAARTRIRRPTAP
jgi:hypothetical protein